MAEIKRRAVTDAQKQFRRQEILDGARAHFAQVGYENFSMNQLAKRLGIVKGTLYLYFPTKESIILALYGRALEAWSEALKAELRDGLPDPVFIAHFYDLAMADPVLVPILIRLEHVIEHNVSIELLIHSKRHFKACLDSIAEGAHHALALSRQQTDDLIISLGVLLAGATHSDQGPALANEDLPDDVRTIFASLSSREVFSRNAARILAGIRAAG